MRYSKLLLLFLGFCSLAFGCGSPVHYKPVELHGHVRNDKYGFCFRVPEEWEIRSYIRAAEVMCLSPKQGDDDPFRENVAVAVKELRNTPSDAEWAEENLSKLGQEPLERGMDEGLEYAIYEHSEGGLKVRSLAYFKVHQFEGSTYGLVFLFTTAQLDHFNDWQELFHQIRSSFKFDISQCPETGPPPEPEVTRTPQP